MSAACYIDTNIFLNVIYQEPPFFRGSTRFLRAVQEGRLLGVTSSVTMAEIALDLAKTGNREKIDQILGLIERMNNLKLLPLDSLTARLAVKLVLDSRMTVHDAYHGATAIENGASIFVTRDKFLLGKLRRMIRTAEPEHVSLP